MNSKQAVLEIVSALLDAVRESGRNGVPGGHLYAATMSVISLEQFQVIMSALVEAGKVTKQGELYFPVPLPPVWPPS